MKKSEKIIKKEYSVTDEFFVVELESRLEMKAQPWVKIVPCDDPTHCHPWNQ